MISVEFYLKKFLALFALTMIGEIHWDMRDILSDNMNGIKTLPTVIGMRSTKIVILVSLFICFFWFGIISPFSLIFMTVLVLMAGYNVSNMIYHLPPLVALYNFLIKG
jgi:1,4-dihydroxy-2-naphthoate octaprenyltransferase